MTLTTTIGAALFGVPRSTQSTTTFNGGGVERADFQATAEVGEIVENPEGIFWALTPGLPWVVGTTDGQQFRIERTTMHDADQLEVQHRWSQGSFFAFTQACLSQVKPGQLARVDTDDGPVIIKGITAREEQRALERSFEHYLSASPRRQRQIDAENAALLKAPETNAPVAADDTTEPSKAVSDLGWLSPQTRRTLAGLHGMRESKVNEELNRRVPAGAQEHLVSLGAATVVDKQLKITPAGKDLIAAARLMQVASPSESDYRGHDVGE